MGSWWGDEKPVESEAFLGKQKKKRHFNTIYNIYKL